MIFASKKLYLKPIVIKHNKYNKIKLIITDILIMTILYGPAVGRERKGASKF